MRSVFLDYATVSFNGDLDSGRLLRAIPGLELRGDEAGRVGARIAGHEVVLLNKLRIDRALIAATPTLKLIALAATGTNNVDLEAAREHGIAVCNIRDYCTPSVAQHVLGMVLALTHRLREYYARADRGTWPRSDAVLAARLPDPRALRPHARHGRLGHARQGGGAPASSRSA